jgi:replicative DNA helicase
MSVQPIKKNPESEWAISQATNYELEATLVGIPLWLKENGRETEAVLAMRTISRQPEDLFVRHTHRLLWAAFKALSIKGVAPTEAWIKQVTMGLNGWSDDEADKASITTGLLDELTEAGSCALTIKLGESPLMLVKEIVDELWTLYRRRSVIHSVEDLHRQVTSWQTRSDQDVSAAIDHVRTAFSLRPDSEETASTLGSLVRQDLAVLERQMSGEEPDHRIFTGFGSLDRWTGGMVPGNLVIVAARPAMGKTSLALDFALSVAKADVLTTVFSFEMGRHELVRRIEAKEAGLDVLRLRNGNLQDWELDRCRQVFPNGSDLPLVIDDGNFTPEGIEQRLRHFNAMANPARVGFVIVDHLQIMGARDTTRYERRDRQLAHYTGQLKDLAKRLGVVILCLSQLNRQSANRPLDERLPRLSDLRESGAIEQDADVILGIYRKHPDTNAEDDRHHAEVCCMKNRNGPVFKLALNWIGHHAKFTDPTRGDDIDPKTAPF